MILRVKPNRELYRLLHHVIVGTGYFLHPIVWFRKMFARVGELGDLQV